MPWQDLDGLTPVNGWCTFRAAALDERGVTEFVVMHLMHQETGEVMEFSLSLDVARRLGYDLLGDGCGITEYEDDDDD